MVFRLVRLSVVGYLTKHQLLSHRLTGIPIAAHYKKWPPSRAAIFLLYILVSATILLAMTTIRHALAAAATRLADSPTPQIDARLLLQHQLDVASSYLLSHDDRVLTATEQAHYAAWVTRAAGGEPIPYIIGFAPFYDADFLVTPDVLIPRPETEELVAQIIAAARNAGEPALLVDIGTGSGCIPITLARHVPDATVLAGDVSPAALALAQENGRRLGVADRIGWRIGDLWLPFADEEMRNRPVFISANLPYITDAEWTALDDRVKFHEPALALRGGSDGLTLIRRLLHQLQPIFSAATESNLDTQPRELWLEIGWQQGEAARELATELLPQADVTLQQDYADNDRFVHCRLRNAAAS